MSGIELVAFALAVAAAVFFAIAAGNWASTVRANWIAVGLCLLTASWIIVTPAFSIA